MYYSVGFEKGVGKEEGWEIRLKGTTERYWNIPSMSVEGIRSNSFTAWIVNEKNVEEKWMHWSLGIILEKIRVNQKEMQKIQWLSKCVLKIFSNIIFICS